MDFEDQVEEAFEREDMTATGYVNFDGFCKIAEKFGLTSKYLQEEYFHRYDREQRGRIDQEDVYDILKARRDNPELSLPEPQALTFEEVSNEKFLTTLKDIENPNVLKK